MGVRQEFHVRHWRHDGVEDVDGVTQTLDEPAAAQVHTGLQHPRLLLLVGGQHRSQHSLKHVHGMITAASKIVHLVTPQAKVFTSMKSLNIHYLQLKTSLVQTRRLNAFMYVYILNTKNYVVKQTVKPGRNIYKYVTMHVTFDWHRLASSVNEAGSCGRSVPTTANTSADVSPVDWTWNRQYASE